MRNLGRLFAENRIVLGSVLLLLGAILIKGVLTGGMQDSSHSVYSTYNLSRDGFANLRETVAAEGIPTEQFSYSKTALDDRYGVLIISAQRGHLQEQPGKTFEEIHYHDWIAHGGTVLVFNDRVNDKAGGKPISADGNCERAARSNYFVANHVDDIRIPRDMPRAKLSCQGVEYADAAGPIAVRERIGSGSAFTISPARAFDNEQLSIGDRARLAVALVTQARPGIVAFDEVPHGYESGRNWLTLFPASVRIALAVAAIGWALRLLGGIVRFGPARNAVEVASTSRYEYIEAVTSLLERGEAWDFDRPNEDVRGQRSDAQAFLARVAAAQLRRKGRT